jgi:hypothetical protein
VLARRITARRTGVILPVPAGNAATAARIGRIGRPSLRYVPQPVLDVRGPCSNPYGSNIGAGGAAFAHGRFDHLIAKNIPIYQMVCLRNNEFCR